MKKETKRKIQVVSITLFIIYLIMMTYCLFFAESLGRDYSQRDYSYNLQLFREIRRFVEYREVLGITSVILNLAGNVVCFIPMGTFLPVISRKARNFFLTTLFCFWFSFVVECVQLVTKTGSFDVDDLLLNTSGAVIGFLIFTICNVLRRKHYG